MLQKIKCYSCKHVCYGPLLSWSWDVSGWNTYTGLLVHLCKFDATPIHLEFSNKWCFMDHCQILPRRNEFQLNRVCLNGNIEDSDPPR